MPKDNRPYAHNSTLRVPRAPMKKRNEERQQRRQEADLVYGTHHQAIKTFTCDLIDHQHHKCGYFEDRPKVEGHHLRSVGSGGEDRNNEIPACPVLHDEFERTPLSEMCRKYHRDFKSVACDYTRCIENEVEFRTLNEGD